MKVSVSVTTYDHEPWIAQALEGILAQQAPFEWEIVIGEDRSRDRTREIVLEYAARYPALIRTVLPDENLGDGGKPLFAATLERCRGEYIAFLDGDDYWTTPDKLARQARFLDDHPDASMCYHNALRLHEGESRPDVPHNPPGQARFTSLDQILEHCMPAACTPLFRREVLVPLPSWYEDVPFGDWPLYIVAATRGRIGYIDEMMGVYRIHGEGAWSGLDELERARQLLSFYERIAALPSLEGHARAGRLLGRQHFKLARELVQVGEIGAAQRSVWRALRAGAGGAEVPWSEVLGLLLKLARLRMRDGWRAAAPGRAS